jgi:DNA-binding response OmpR family regulator
MVFTTGRFEFPSCRILWKSCSRTFEKSRIHSRIRQVRLIREGWVVLTASDPVEGLRSYEVYWQGISLVLLDYYMPGLRGDEVWERLKRINPQARVLLMTASDDYLPAGFLNGGVYGFVQKPATRKELLQRIREALNHHDQ